MKKLSFKQFSILLYYEHIQIAHLFDTIQIRKNVSRTLQRILDLRSDKEEIVKICNDIPEANHAMKDAIQLHRNRDKININSLPWFLTHNKAIL